MIRIDLHMLDAPLSTELQNRPIMPGPAPARRLPTVAHMHAARGHQKVDGFAEKRIARAQRSPAIFDTHQVDLTHPRPAIQVRRGLAVHPQARDAAVREDIEAKMRKTRVAIDLEFVFEVPLERRFSKDFDPLDIAL